jgi:uncharacterized protein
MRCMLNGADAMPMPTEFTPIASSLGGVLIGASAVLLMLFHGRIAGITNIVGRLLPPRSSGDPAHAAAFLAGLTAAPLVYAAAGATVTQTVSANVPLMLAGGLLVGFGAAYGGGCTSGMASAAWRACHRDRLPPLPRSWRWDLPPCSSSAI